MSEVEVVNTVAKVEVDSPFAEQFVIPSAQLMTVTTLVTKVVESGNSAGEGETTGCAKKISELVKMPPTTLLGCISGVANTCPVGPYIKSAASSMLPSSLAWLGTGLTSSKSVQSPSPLLLSALKLTPTQKEFEVELSWLYEAHCVMHVVKSSADRVMICSPVYVVPH